MSISGIDPVTRIIIIQITCGGAVIANFLTDMKDRGLSSPTGLVFATTGVVVVAGIIALVNNFNITHRPTTVGSSYIYIPILHCLS